MAVAWEVAEQEVPAAQSDSLKAGMHRLDRDGDGGGQGKLLWLLATWHAHVSATGLSMLSSEGDGKIRLHFAPPEGAHLSNLAQVVHLLWLTHDVMSKTFLIGDPWREPLTAVKLPT